MTNSIAIRDNNTIDNRRKPMWDLTEEKPRLYPGAVDFSKEKGIPLSSVYAALNGMTRTCHGRVISYDENVADTQSKMVEQIGTLRNKLSAREKKDADAEKKIDELKKKAALWDAYQAEQEAARKAEEKHQQAIAKATEKRDRLYNKYILAMELYEEAERELSALLEGGNGNV